MIIDCITFFDELDLLEIRFNELKGLVSVFVVCEGLYTFTGKRKPLYFYENRDRFKDFNVAHAVFDAFYTGDPSSMEKAQNQYALDFVFDYFFNTGDVIIQTDCDEIPNSNVIQDHIFDDYSSIQLSMSLFYYFMNCIESNHRTWRNGRLIRPNRRFEYNVRQNDKNDMVLRDAGWHFSFLTKSEGNIQRKLHSWGHAKEYDKPPYNTYEHIKKCREQGLDLFMRIGKKQLDFEFLEDLDYLPKYVLDNMDKFDKYIRTERNTSL